ncbi:MAG TPA: lysylphosphatidylglycerol synthase transmembrane domain-containing protein [Thermodesulfobacteriota bacterium]|nr:lysylphosphatidylglycerol synthase transmembrane domain-containing protein [Thermodesulfobacteriota bacterium]
MKKLTSILLSLIILAVIYWKIDLRSLGHVFKNCNGWWIVISLGILLPNTLLAAGRLRQLLSNRAKLSFSNAYRLILAASTLNVILPMKIIGDLAKAYFIKAHTKVDGTFSLSLILFEKACDMISLFLLCGVGLILYPKKDWFLWLMTVSVILGLTIVILLIGSRYLGRLFFKLGQLFIPYKYKGKLENLRNSWFEMHKLFWSDKIRLFKIIFISIFIWFLHLLQIWFFILSLKAWTPFLANLALAPLAILAGLLPLTLAGIGTRDAALIALYQPFFNAPTAAAVGLLCTSRYLLPAILGLPFLGRYLPTIRTVTKKPGTFSQVDTEL